MAINFDMFGPLMENGIFGDEGRLGYHKINA